MLQQAEALIEQPKQPKPLRTTITDTEIKRMAEYVYAKALAWDERTRYGRDELKRIEAEHVRLEGRPLSGPWAFPYETLPPHGLSREQLAERRQQLMEDLSDMREYLALGDVSAVEDHVADALDAFQINLDRSSLSYPKLGIEVLRAYVRALQDIERRNAGEPVPTPTLAAAPTSTASASLREALEGWKKERDRPEDGVHEYTPRRKPSWPESVQIRRCSECRVRAVRDQQVCERTECRCTARHLTRERDESSDGEGRTYSQHGGYSRFVSA